MKEISYNCDLTQKSLKFLYEWKILASTLELNLQILRQNIENQNYHFLVEKLKY